MLVSSPPSFTKRPFKGSRAYYICTVIDNLFSLQEESNKTTGDSSKAHSNTGSSSSRDSGWRRSGRGSDGRGRASTSCGGGRAVSSQGAVGDSWLDCGLVAGAGSIWCERASGVDANALKLSTLGGDNSHWRLASDIEETVEGGSDGGKILLCDTEGHGREGDLINEVGNLGI